MSTKKQIWIREKLKHIRNKIRISYESIEMLLVILFTITVFILVNLVANFFSSDLVINLIAEGIGIIFTVLLTVYFLDRYLQKRKRDRLKKVLRYHASIIHHYITLLLAISEKINLSEKKLINGKIDTKKREQIIRALNNINGERSERIKFMTILDQRIRTFLNIHNEIIPDNVIEYISFIDLEISKYIEPPISSGSPLPKNWAKLSDNEFINKQTKYLIIIFKKCQKLLEKEGLYKWELLTQDSMIKELESQ